MIPWLNELIPLISSHTALFAFLAGLLVEEALIFFGILAGQRIIELQAVIIFGFLGVVIFDSFIFVLARSKYGAFVKNLFYSTREQKKRPQILHPHNTHKYALAIFLSKFIYGARTFTIWYVSGKHLSYKRFVVYDILATVAWMALLFPIAWLAGRGISKYLFVAQHIERLLLLTAAVVVLLYLLDAFILKKITRKFN